MDILSGPNYLDPPEPNVYIPTDDQIKESILYGLKYAQSTEAFKLREALCALPAKELRSVCEAIITEFVGF